MAFDTRDIAGFYATALGGLTASLLRRELADLWPHVNGLKILGIGHARPCLEPWQAHSHCFEVAPANMGEALSPANKPGLICLAETESLPFADLSFDRVLLIHGLEQAENVRRTLREAWRVLKDDGKLIVVLPNRRGVWAYAETTPFGHGQPYSERQLARLLASLSFTVEQEKSILYALPFKLPFNWRLMQRLFWFIEGCGPFLVPHFAGLVIAEASKTIYGVRPAGKRAFPRRVLVAGDV